MDRQTKRGTDIQTEKHRQTERQKFRLKLAFYVY